MGNLNVKPMAKILSLENGKYEVFSDGVHTEVHRYKNSWRDLTGDKFTNLLISELVEAKQMLAKHGIVKTFKPDRAPMRMLSDTTDGIHPPYTRFKNPLEK